jgi:hypothetical protein
MKALARFQRDFLEQVYGDAPAAGPAAIYRRNVLANLHDALAAAYPVVRRLVGDAFFGAAAERFARAHPSTSGDLHRYGAELAQFLAGYAPAADLPYLPDVACLEWAVAQAFHAANARAFDYAALAAIAAPERERVCLRLQPAARLVASAHPILDIWEANQPARDGVPAKLCAEARVLVFRAGLEVRVRALSTGEWSFLSAAASGATLAALAADPILAPILAGELVQWARLTVIDGFDLCSPRA